MNTEIVTFYYGDNYGGLLQAYCMRDFIEKTFSDNVSFFPYQPNQLSEADLWGQLKTKNPIRIINIIGKYYKIKNWKHQKANFPRPSSIVNESNSDISIFGSDEIWNYSNPIIGTDYTYFGSCHPKKKIAYAVSSGNAQEKIKNVEKNKELAELLSQFHTILVRDKPTQSFVKGLINQNVKIVVDPTLLHTPRRMEKNKISVPKIKSNHAIVYGTYFNPDEQNLIKKISKNNELKLISVGYHNKWCDSNYLYKDPIQFLGYLIGANLVFTSMFHGIMLSVKYEKNFWYSSDPYRVNKVNYFINRLGLEKRNLNKGCYKMMNNINYENINELLTPWIEESRKLLIGAYNS